MRDLAVKDESLLLRPCFLSWGYFMGVSVAVKKNGPRSKDRGPFGATSADG